MRYYSITGRFSGAEEYTLLLITAEDEENEIYINTLVWANTPIF